MGNRGFYSPDLVKQVQSGKDQGERQAPDWVCVRDMIGETAAATVVRMAAGEGRDHQSFLRDSASVSGESGGRSVDRPITGRCLHGVNPKLNLYGLSGNV